jgi:peptide deformylase
MALRPILIAPHPVLSMPAATVARIDDDLRALAADMLETMYAAPGRGLAAPQVGESLALFVMDAGWKQGEPAPRVLVNPRLLWASEETALHEEACLSIPDRALVVERPAAVRMAWEDLDGASHEAELSGVEAVIAQHEFDHLLGVLITDRVP